jgi:hypothetical protein
MLVRAGRGGRTMEFGVQTGTATRYARATGLVAHRTSEVRDARPASFLQVLQQHPDITIVVSKSFYKKIGQKSKTDFYSILSITFLGVSR